MNRNLKIILLALIICGSYLYFCSTPAIEKASHTGAKTAQTRLEKNEKVTPIKASEKTGTRKELTVKQVNHQLDGLLVEHIKALQEKLAKGDGEAGYILAKNLHRCLLTPRREQQIEEVTQQIYDAGEDEQGKFTTGLKKQFEFCQGIEQQTIMEYLDYYYQAAQLGFGPAISQYAQLNSAPIHDERYNRLSGAEKKAFVFEHRMQLIEMLEVGASGGDLNSMLTLYEFAINDQYTLDGKPVNRSKAYAYLTVYLELIDDHQLYDIYAQSQQRDLAKLTAQEIESATEISRKVIKEIYKNGILYGK